MKDIIGLIAGFVLGTAGFLFLFKILVLDRTSPEDELAPGIVMLAAIGCGCLFAFIGSRIQRSIAQKNTST